MVALFAVAVFAAGAAVVYEIRNRPAVEYRGLSFELPNY